MMQITYKGKIVNNVDEIPEEDQWEYQKLLLKNQGYKTMAEIIDSGLTLDNNNSGNSFPITTDSRIEFGNLGGTAASTGLYFSPPLYNNFSDKMKIFQKINDAMEEVGWIGKDGTVDLGRNSYDFASERAFIGAIRPVFTRLGLVFYPTRVISQEIITSEKKNKDGNVSNTFLTSVLMEYILGDVDSGEFITIQVMGHGSDSGDKGVYKALTGAFKYALRQALMIGTGDDPEGTDDYGNDTSEPIRSAPSGGDYAPARPTQPARPDGVNHYQEQTRKALEGLDLADATKIFKKRKIDPRNLPTDQTTLRALYEFAREVRGGKSVADAIKDLDTKLG